MPFPDRTGRTFRPQPLDREELDLLFGACSKRSSAGIRQAAMIAVMYGSGLRVAEMLDLYPRNVDTRTGRVEVENGKGGQARTVGMRADMAPYLDRWLDRRTALGLNGRHHLFATYSKNSFGRPLAPNQVRNGLRRLAIKTATDKRIHPHGFRHSLAVAMAQDRLPMNVVQRQLGHGSLATTSNYLDHLHPADVIDAVRDMGQSTDPT